MSDVKLPTPEEIQAAVGFRCPRCNARSGARLALCDNCEAQQHEPRPVQWTEIYSGAVKLDALAPEAIDASRRWALYCRALIENRNVLSGADYITMSQHSAVARMCDEEMARREAVAMQRVTVAAE